MQLPLSEIPTYSSQPLVFESIERPFDSLQLLVIHYTERPFHSSANRNHDWVIEYLCPLESGRQSDVTHRASGGPLKNPVMFHKLHATHRASERFP